MGTSIVGVRGKSGRVDHCADRTGNGRADKSLPVLPGEPAARKIRPSKSGRRRAIVLITVQLLMIAHVVQWLITGHTITPIEPSETKDLTSKGVINAGAIFFGSALLSTLIWGRWFCGWGCHVVMLQDFCGWLMKKCGVRPRAFRSRLLLYAPLALAFYMFFWPLVARFVVQPLFGHSPDWPGFEVHLTTKDFWRTFPGPLLTIPFLLICGFGTVYFLGAKGFCTYGCPYGGLFAPIDKWAVGRIRVTEDCHQCGHCTAVCTSNVRVHDEVREYGMVVDPGCMKCLDCVSVCPNDALYFGFGKPAALKGEPKTNAPRVTFDLTRGEEIALAVVIVAAFVSTLGVYHLIPGLMASGWAGVVAFLSWKAWRLVRDANVTLNRFQLKRGGRITTAGAVFGMVAFLSIVLTVHSGLVRAIVYSGERYDRAISSAPTPQVLDGVITLEDERNRDLAQTALDRYRWARPIWNGGIGLGEDLWLNERLIWCLYWAMRYREAELAIREVIERGAANQFVLAIWPKALHKLGRDDEADAAYAHLLAEYPQLSNVWYEWGRVKFDNEKYTDAAKIYRDGLRTTPTDKFLLDGLYQAHLRLGDPRTAVHDLREVASHAPLNPDVHNILASALAAAGELKEAENEFKEAIRLSPKTSRFHRNLGILYQNTGRTQEAAVKFEEADRVRAAFPTE